jgi:hypothetical protein
MKRIILLALLVLLMTNCSSTQLAYQNRTKKYLDRKIEYRHRQFVVVNNQIIMFENGPR